MYNKKYLNLHKWLHLLHNNPLNIRKIKLVTQGSTVRHSKINSNSSIDVSSSTNNNVQISSCFRKIIEKHLQNVE